MPDVSNPDVSNPDVSSSPNSSLHSIWAPFLQQLNGRCTADSQYNTQLRELTKDSWASWCFCCDIASSLKNDLMGRERGQSRALVITQRCARGPPHVQTNLQANEQTSQQRTKNHAQQATTNQWLERSYSDMKLFSLWVSKTHKGSNNFLSICLLSHLLSETPRGAFEFATMVSQVASCS